MNYLIIGYDAIKAIVGHRKLQSFEYEECKKFISFIQSETTALVLWDLYMIEHNEGRYIYTKNSTISKGIIFDLKRFKGFSQEHKPSETLTIFQKILRFSIRNEEKMPFSSSVKVVSNHLSIIFPFPTANHEIYKIAIDKNPDEKRMRKRGNFIYVYDDGSKNFDVITSYSDFRKAFESLKSLPTAQLNKIVNNNGLETIEVVNLDTNQNLSIDANVGFESWQYYLTENQKRFVENPTIGPQRLEGAAGTGKTLTLILRAIYLIKEYDKNRMANDKPLNLLFITHSTSTKNQISSIFKANFPKIADYSDRTYSEISIEITTLQELSLKYLGAGISNNEYLDRDAQDSKDYQLMIIDEALTKIIEEDFDSYKEFCSEKFIHFIENTEKNEILEMIQHEIAVSIKGRANEDIEKYRDLTRFKHSIPVEKEGDLNFLFLIYQNYQDKLTKTGQFDSDDIILSTLGKLNTPIWRRRKELEGFDLIFIDETHLFNFNELAVFHHLNKNHAANNIIFAVDKSQAIGDKGLSDNVLYSSLGLDIPTDSTENSFNYKTVFRSSPAIVRLAFEVLSSGTTLFTNFENPMDKVEFSFTDEEERKSQEPEYIFKENDDEIIKESFNKADKICKQLNTKRSKVLIIATSPLLLTQLTNFAKNQNKSFEIIKNRGDAEVVKSADRTNRYVIGGIDYVGGLEFDAVIIIGADKNRVPPSVSDESLDSHHFLSYAWHNRMYVAITRAKYLLVLIGEKSRGRSKLFDSAIEKGILKVS